MINSEAKAYKMYEQAKALREEQEQNKQPTPTIDSLHDSNGNPTFNMGDGHLDCRYPVFEPHLILAEMQKILLEVRQIRDSLGFFGIETESTEDTLIKAGLNIFQDLEDLEEDD